MPATHRAGVLLAAVFIGLTGFCPNPLHANNQNAPQPDRVGEAAWRQPVCKALVAVVEMSLSDSSKQASQPHCASAAPAIPPFLAFQQEMEVQQAARAYHVGQTPSRDAVRLEVRIPVEFTAIQSSADAADTLENTGQYDSGLVREELDWSGVPAETQYEQWGEMPIDDCGNTSCQVYQGGCKCPDCCDITYPNLGPLGYLLLPSDACLSDFISPMTNPVYFEDPRSLTEVRGIFLNNSVPSEAGGGQVRVFALQARAALSDRLSVVTTKSGFISSSHPVIADGWADLTAGLKYNVVSDPCTGHLFSLGATYDFSIGSSQSFQDTGDGRINAFVSGGTRIGSRVHWLSAAGYHIPMDTSIDSQSLYWSNHLDFQLSECIYLLAECNWYHWTKSGSGGIDGLEGLDLFNFGSTGVAGKDIATGALGIKLKPHRHAEVGVAWETPITDERDIMEDRLTVDFILRY